MATYLWINPDRFRKVGKELEVDGVELRVELSPFDVPSGVTGRYNQSVGEFEIRFDYIDNELPQKSKRVSGLRFDEGRYSGKLLAIHIPVDRSQLRNVGLIQLQTAVVKALKQRTEQLEATANTDRPLGPILNWKAAKVVVENEHDFSTLARELVPTH